MECSPILMHTKHVLNISQIYLIIWPFKRTELPSQIDQKNIIEGEEENAVDFRDMLLGDTPKNDLFIYFYFFKKPD